MIKWSITPENW